MSTVDFVWCIHSWMGLCSSTAKLVALLSKMRSEMQEYQPRNKKEAFELANFDFSKINQKVLTKVSGENSS